MRIKKKKSSLQYMELPSFWNCTLCIHADFIHLKNDYSILIQHFGLITLNQCF